MYVADSRGVAEARGALRPEPRTAGIAPTVFALGTVSLITDISSEMVTAVLPLYLVAGLGLSPLGFGFLDGVYNGFSAVVRLAGGHLADRRGRHKAVAAIGYGLSALCKPLLLAVHGLPLIGAVLAVVLMAAAAGTVPPSLRSSGLALVQTGQAAARFACSIAFGAAWIVCGDHTALATAALALAVCVAGTVWLRPAEVRR
jgi:hypothetical protein